MNSQHGSRATCMLSRLVIHGCAWDALISVTTCVFGIAVLCMWTMVAVPGLTASKKADEEGKWPEPSMCGVHGEVDVCGVQCSRAVSRGRGTVNGSCMTLASSCVPLSLCCMSLHREW